MRDDRPQALFELTQGATLILNPNVDQVALYPAEIEALLNGHPLGYFTQETLQADEEGWGKFTFRTD